MVGEMLIGVPDVGKTELMMWNVVYESLFGEESIVVLGMSLGHADSLMRLFLEQWGDTRMKWRREAPRTLQLHGYGGLRVFFDSVHTSPYQYIGSYKTKLFVDNYVKENVKPGLVMAWCDLLESRREMEYEDASEGRTMLERMWRRMRHQELNNED